MCEVDISEIISFFRFNGMNKI